jgi:hypothetical protein
VTSNAIFFENLFLNYQLTANYITWANFHTCFLHVYCQFELKEATKSRVLVIFMTELIFSLQLLNFGNFCKICSYITFILLNHKQQWICQNCFRKRHLSSYKVTAKESLLSTIIISSQVLKYLS